MFFIMYPAAPAAVFLPSHNQIQYLLGKGDNNSAGQGHEAVGSLGRVVGFERQTHLHYAEAQQYQAYCSYQAEDESGQIVYNCYGVSCCQARHCCQSKHQHAAKIRQQQVSHHMRFILHLFLIRSFLCSRLQDENLPSSFR